MSFRQQLARKSVNVHQAWLADIKNKFMQECEKASESGRFSCVANYKVPDDLSDLQQLRGILMELGFPEGKVEMKFYNGEYVCRMTVSWSHEDATCTASPPQTSGGTCTYHLSHLPRASACCGVDAMWPCDLPRVSPFPAASPMPHASQAHHFGHQRPLCGLKGASSWPLMLLDEMNGS